MMAAPEPDWELLLLPGNKAGQVTKSPPRKTEGETEGETEGGD